jgi:predicted dehydrogenase
MAKGTSKSSNAASTHSTRRQFLQRTALAAGAVTFAAPAIVRGRNLNEKLNIAIIGAGGRGAHNASQVVSENIVVLCDVNESNLNQTAQKFPDAKKFTDFRKVYDESQKFDAVVVSTCEHTHAFATLPALQLGKHVYCEKPLTHNIWEARIIREAAAKTKLATQMGIQIHATENYRRVVELIQSGAIGPVREAHVWVSRAWGRQPSEEESKKHKDLVYVQERPQETEPVPAGLDWELWLGPAPYRPFHSVYFPGPKWYRWWDFGNGTMSDLGSHWNDLPFWALKLKAPLTIEAFGPPVHAEIAPASMRAVYEFGPRGDMPAVTMTWYQGTEKPEIWKSGGIPQFGNGVLFVGDKGMLLSDYSKHVLLPEKQFEGFKAPEPFLARSPGHHAEWINACKTGEPCSAGFEYSGWLTESNHLGNVAYRAGKKLQWDPAGLRATNCPEADAFIRRQYRDGWKLG